MERSRRDGCDQIEGSKSIEEYVTLPAKKYSVLDSDSVQKLGGNRFRVSGGKQNLMLGQKGEPVGVRRPYRLRGPHPYVSPSRGSLHANADQASRR